MRASQLTDGTLTGRYRVAPDFTPRGGRKISRTDVAHFIAATVTDGGWLKSAPPSPTDPGPGPGPKSRAYPTWPG